MKEKYKIIRMKSKKKGNGGDSGDKEEEIPEFFKVYHVKTIDKYFEILETYISFMSSIVIVFISNLVL